MTLNDLVGYGFGEKEVEHVRMIGAEDLDRPIILTNDKFTEKHLEDINKSEEEIIEQFGDRKIVFALMKAKGNVSQLEVLKEKYFNKKSTT